MRELFSVLAAAAFALSIVAGGCAKEKAPSPPEPAKKERAAIETKTAPKPHMRDGLLHRETWREYKCPDE